MAIKAVSIKCPECGASLDVEEGRKQLFCEYCGAKIMLENDHEYTYRSIDEAEIKKAETERILRLKEFEKAERAEKISNKVKIIVLSLSLALGASGIIMIAVGFSNDDYIGLSLAGLFAIEGAPFVAGIGFNLFDNSEDKEPSNRIQVPISMSNAEGKEYSVVEAQFRGAGFSNITCVPLKDLRVGLLKKQGTVASLSVDGNTVVVSGQKCAPDVSVIISYHSFANE